ncbi:MAG: porin family protein [Flavobacteriaceae bacterium]|nr:porin family protein [Flavobacteriaceae bacterium]
MKLLTTTLILLFFTIIGFAQETYYGFRAGLNYSTLNFDSNDDDVDGRYGLVVGGFIDHEFSEKLSLLAELQYSAEGAKQRELRADYIQLPLMLRYKIGEWFKVGLGPQGAIKVWSHEDGFQNVVFSGVAGIEYMFTDELFFDLRYSFGLSDVLDDEIPLDARNNYVQLGFGIKL